MSPWHFFVKLRLGELIGQRVIIYHYNQSRWGLTSETHNKFWIPMQCINLMLKLMFLHWIACCFKCSGVVLSTPFRLWTVCCSCVCASKFVCQSQIVAHAGVKDCGFDIVTKKRSAHVSCIYPCPLTHSPACSFHLQQSESLFPAVTSSLHALQLHCPSSHFLARQEMSRPRGVLLIGEVWVDKDTPVSTTLDSVFPLSLVLNGAPK